MKGTAKGKFEVKLAPQPADDYADGKDLGRMTIDKHFLGDMEGSSKGQMLTGMTAVSGSAAYVAIERVNGALAGRTGTFILQHTGTMARGAQSLVVKVVPDSGTGEFAGIDGTMAIDISNGLHLYTFEYTLPDQE